MLCLDNFHLPSFWDYSNYLMGKSGQLTIPVEVQVQLSQNYILTINFVKKKNSHSKNILIYKVKQFMSKKNMLPILVDGAKTNTLKYYTLNTLKEYKENDILHLNAMLDPC
jgi:hypothetical protein